METRYKNAEMVNEVPTLNFVEVDKVMDLDNNEVETIKAEHSLTVTQVEEEIVRIEKYLDHLRNNIELDTARLEQLRNSLVEAKTSLNLQ